MFMYGDFTEHKFNIKNQVEAKEQGFPLVEIESAYDGTLWEKGYAPEKPQEVKEKEVRAVRNQYLIDFVDPYQLVIRWGTLSETEQSYLIEYRQYLLDYTNNDGWWKQNPDDYETWLVAHHPVTTEVTEADSEAALQINEGDL